MKLIGEDGYGVELGVVGYQFPDATDPRQRRSWLIVEGTARCPQGGWTFRWQALTCDDAVSLARWLQAGVGDRPSTDGNERGRDNSALGFTEPNLAFALSRTESDEIELRVSLDLEFSPPWRKRARAGSPVTVLCRITPEVLQNAAIAWAAEIAPYPP